MKNDLILANVAKHITLDQDEVHYFTSLLKYREVEKGASLLKEEDVSCKIIPVLAPPCP